MSLLLRFNKSVCKSWRATSIFVDRPTTTTTSSSSKFGDTFIIQTSEPSAESYQNDIKMFMLSSGSAGDDQSQKNKKKMVFKLNEDLGFSTFFKDFLLDDSLRMVGSCNGIICLHDPKAMDYHLGYCKQHYSNLRDVCLWNPATRQFRILPKSIPIQDRKKPHAIPSLRYCEGTGKESFVLHYKGTGTGTFVEDLVAFGFDVKTKDYKVLRITPLWEESKEEEGGECKCRVQVYSLSTDSWRLLEDIVIPNQHHTLNGNGSCFFVGRKPYSTDGNGMMLLSFDFTNEIFTTMQLPDNNGSICKLVLSYLGEKWAAAFTTPRIYSDGGYWYFDVLVLNEQHSSVAAYKEESWTKLHSFRIKTKSKQPYSKPKPRCISNNEEFALISTGRNKFHLFNLVTKEAMKDFTIGDRDWDRRCCAAYAYEESLVSIMGGNVLLRWQLPTHGTTYKLNLDAPFVDSDFNFGIGLCLTSDTGGCIGVRSLQRRHVRDATKGEALAMLETIKWAKMLELSPIIIESDSKNVVSFFMDDDDDDDNNSTYWSSEALSLLREAKLLLNSSEIGSISLKYCSKSRNYVADIAAKLGREGFWHCMDWTANSPGEIVMSLSMDLGIKTSYE